jgi:hypothetical protein
VPGAKLNPETLPAAGDVGVMGDYSTRDSLSKRIAQAALRSLRLSSIPMPGRTSERSQASMHCSKV